MFESIFVALGVPYFFFLDVLNQRLIKVKLYMIWVLHFNCFSLHSAVPAVERLPVLSQTEVCLIF